MSAATGGGGSSVTMPDPSEPVSGGISMRFPGVPDESVGFSGRPYGG